MHTKARLKYWWEHQSTIGITYHIIKTRLRVWRNNKYNGPDEFHHSYNIDCEAIMYMNSKQRDKYYKTLCKRRQQAHNKDIQKERYKIAYL